MDDLISFSLFEIEFEDMLLHIHCMLHMARFANQLCLERLREYNGVCGLLYSSTKKQDILSNFLPSLWKLEIGNWRNNIICIAHWRMHRLSIASI
jgi:hypothetical protein